MSKTYHVAVIGGGQLARMLIEASLPQGNIKISTLDPSDKSPAALVGQCHVSGSFNNDPQGDNIFAFFKLAEAQQSVPLDVVTFEIEHIDVNGLEKALQRFNESRSVQLQAQPSLETLKLIQDKFAQKLFLQTQGVPMSDLSEVRSVKDIKALNYAFPMMLKTKRGAYDGKGNFVIKNQEDIELAFQKLTGGTQESDNLFVESWVPYVKEIAVMVAKSKDGTIVTYPVVQTLQQDNICSLVIAPAQILDIEVEDAIKVARQVVGAFDGAGIFGVELFLLEDGTVLLNEVAPRPHNSGHYTIEACHVSQFEQHIRAVCGLPLGSSDMKVPYSVMLNLIGEQNGSEGMQQLDNTRSKVSTIPGAALHWYCKQECRIGRKMGHVTISSDSLAQLSTATGSLNPLYKDFYLNSKKPQVAIIMGSDSDLQIMKDAALVLNQFYIRHLTTIVSAHRTPDRLMEFAKNAASRGLKCIIAGAGGAAHLPGMVAALTPLPVIGVPIALKHLDGVDSLYSIVQMPKGVPCATVAINNASNAGLLAARIVGCWDRDVQERMVRYQVDMERTVLNKAARLEQDGPAEYLKQMKKG